MWGLLSQVVGAEEVDGEAGRALWLDVMLNIGRNALRKIGLDDHVGDRIRASNETQRTGFDAQATPRPGRHSMRPTERVRDRVLIPRRGGPHHDQTVGELATVAERAVQGRADASIPFGCVLDPGCRPETADDDARAGGGSTRVAPPSRQDRRQRSRRSCAARRRAYEHGHQQTRPDWSTPCPVPVDGWHGSTTTTPVPTSLPPDPPLITGLEQVPGYGGSWYDRILDVENVRIVGDDSDRRAAADALGALYDGPVCIVDSTYTEAELTTIQHEIDERYVGLGPEPYSFITATWVQTDASTAAVVVQIAAPVLDREAALHDDSGDAVTIERSYTIID